MFLKKTAALDIKKTMTASSIKLKTPSIASNLNPSKPIIDKIATINEPCIFMIYTLLISISGAIF